MTEHNERLAEARAVCRAAGFYVIPVEAIRVAEYREVLPPRAAIEYSPNTDFRMHFMKKAAMGLANHLIPLVTASDVINPDAPPGSITLSFSIQVIAHGDYMSHPQADPLLETFRSYQRGR